MSIQVGKSDSKHCIVRIGALTRSDPDAEVHIVRSTGPGDKDWERVERKFIEGKKLLKFDLKPGVYHVMVVGDKVAGVVTTAGHVLPFPWNVFLEAPAEHVKDYKRVSIPAQRGPQPSNLAAAIRKTLH